MILREADTGNKIRLLHAKKAWTSVTGIAFSPDGKMLAGCSSDAVLCLWNVATGKRLMNWERQKKQETFTGVLFSPDGKWLALAGGPSPLIFFANNKPVFPPPPGIRVWDMTTGKLLHKYQKIAGWASTKALAFSADSQYLVAGCSDGAVRVWRPSENGDRVLWRKYAHGAQSISLSPDGRWLTTGGNDARLHEWDLMTGKEFRVRKGHASFITSVAFSPDGKRIASGSYDCTVLIWDAER